MQQVLSFFARPTGGSPDRGPSTALAVKEVPARTQALAAERGRLLRGIARRQAEVARLTERLRDAATKMAGHGPLLFQEAVDLSKSLAQMFEALLKDPARSKRARKQIRALYDDVKESGLLDARCGPDDLEDPPSPPARKKTRPETVEPSHVAAASRNGGPARALFRRLADVLHPDKVQDEGEKARRTEVMKQVTQAYQSGDYARLIEIEQSHGHALEGANELYTDEHESRLSAANGVLRKQSRELDRRLRALRAQNAGEMERELEQIKAAVAAIRVVHDFVVRYRDGTIDFKTFLAGPPDVRIEGSMAQTAFSYQGGKKRRSTRSTR